MMISTFGPYSYIHVCTYLSLQKFTSIEHVFNQIQAKLKTNYVVETTDRGNTCIIGIFHSDATTCCLRRLKLFAQGVTLAVVFSLLLPYILTP